MRALTPPTAILRRSTTRARADSPTTVRSLAGSMRRSATSISPCPIVFNGGRSRSSVPWKRRSGRFRRFNWHPGRRHALVPGPSVGGGTERGTCRATERRNPGGTGDTGAGAKPRQADTLHLVRPRAPVSCPGGSALDGGDAHAVHGGLV